MRTAIAVFALMGIISGAHAMSELEAALNIARESLEASVVKMNDALALARGACVGISSELNTLKSLAIAGTGVSAAGATTATAATVAGAVKQKKDNEWFDNYYPIMWSAYFETCDAYASTMDLFTKEESQSIIDNLENFLVPNTEGLDWNRGKAAESMQRTGQLVSSNKKLKFKNAQLGNVRTGTLAASTVLNVAGATVSGMDMKRSGNLSERVSECLAATRELNTTWGQVRVDKMAYDYALQQLDKDTNATENMVISNDEIARVETIVRVCDEWSTIDMSKVDKRATGAFASNVVGTATGVAGTVTSAAANTKDMHLSHTNKEKGLNTASNILSGTTAVAGTAATIFSATQIAAIKHASTVADACEGALK